MTGSAARRCVGVLGGMGPEATVLLMSRVIAMTPAVDDSDHVPLMVDNNTQVPSRIKAIIEKQGEDPGPVLVRMARRLVDAGAEALAMPCNTAHHYAPLLHESVPVPLLDMVEMSADVLARRREGGGLRVGMLASPAVRMAGVFDRAFAARGLEPLYTAQADRILAVIKAIKAGKWDESCRAMLLETAGELRHAGADVLLVSCSELSLIAGTLPSDLPAIDTIDVLAAAVIAFSRGAPPEEIPDRIDIAGSGGPARHGDRPAKRAASPGGA